MLKFKGLLHSLTITFVLLFSTNSSAMEKEYMLKAGFLYNFARFGQWPVQLNENEYFTICSPDKSFIYAANVALKNRKIKHSPLQSLHVVLNEVSLEPCNILFITSDTITDWQKSQLTSYHNIMIVGESAEFIKSGGHIRFFLSSGKIRFEIDPLKLKDAGITMSSKVLRLARVVNR
ncbi:YfiR family protein [Pseudoalteromonas sp. TB64]|uniref:YfiR family protein n=1 Tax=Pseudoalteromonas sp. TB64 TaxID=1938600 RepID=UPI0004239A15|nr:YfiR family protein [Pseudoalteromonas sp. TB64]